jgi:hypothetical protein
MKNKDNARILNQETIREDFTQRGLHLNATGKIKLVKLMFQKLSQIFKAKKKRPIILKWRPTHNDSNLVNSLPKVINEDNVIIDNKVTKIKQILIMKKLEHLVEQRGFQTQEVMIFYGYEV